MNHREGVIGLLSSIGSVGITLTDIEQVVRVAGSIVGLAISVLMFLVWLKKLRSGKQ